MCVEQICLPCVKNSQHSKPTNMSRKNIVRTRTLFYGIWFMGDKDDDITTKLNSSHGRLVPSSFVPLAALMNCWIYKDDEDDEKPNKKMLMNNHITTD